MKLLTCARCHTFQSIFLEWRFCSCRSSAAKLLEDQKSVLVWGAAKIFKLDDQDFMDYLYSGVGNIKMTTLPESSPRLQRRKEKPEL